MAIDITFVTDDEKIDLQQNISFMIETAQSDRDLRQLSHLDAGTWYGRRRAVNQPHADAVTSVQYLCTVWFDLKPHFCDVPPPQPLVDVTGDEIVALHDAVKPIMDAHNPDASYATECVDIGCSYGIYRQNGVAPDAARRTCLEIVCGWYGVPVPAPPAPPFENITGQLRVDRLAYRDDTGYVLPLLCHFGEAFSAYVRRPDDVRVELDRIRNAGYHGIRFWDVLGYYDKNRPGDANQWSAWQGREVTPVEFVAFSGERKSATPNYYEQLKAFLIELRDRKLVAHHSRGDLNSWKWDQVLTHCRRVGEIQREVGAQVIALNESCNESWQNGVPEPEKLREMGDALGPHAIRGNSCGDDGYGGETPDELNRMKRDVAIIHGYRNGESYNRIGHIMAVGYETLPNAKVPGWQGEPAGPGDGVSVGREEHPEALCLMAAMSLATHQAWVYMSGHGVFWNGSISQMTAFREVAKVREYLPKEIMAWPQITHGGDRWRGTRVFVANADGTLRCDHIFAGDGRFVSIIYGAPKTWAVPVERSFDGEVIHPLTGERQSLSLNAGQTWNVAFARGRIVIGTLR